jgi:hypothetical protein
MTVIPAGLVLTALLAGCASAPATAPSPSATSAPATATGKGCDTSLWAHVYHPYRLHVISPCKTVTGTIEKMLSEPDGDTHWLLKPDPQYASLVNLVNTRRQHGDLVLEAVCVSTVTQADARSACHGFTSSVGRVSPGEHVRVTGSYVLDADHGWTEIHPVSRITMTG